MEVAPLRADDAPCVSHVRLLQHALAGRDGPIQHPLAGRVHPMHVEDVSVRFMKRTEAAERRCQVEDPLPCDRGSCKLLT